jgi:hypothetical protein
LSKFYRPINEFLRYVIAPRTENNPWNIKIFSKVSLLSRQNVPGSETPIEDGYTIGDFLSRFPQPLRVRRGRIGRTTYGRFSTTC